MTRDRTTASARTPWDIEFARFRTVLTDGFEYVQFTVENEQTVVFGDENTAEIVDVNALGSIEWTRDDLLVTTQQWNDLYALVVLIGDVDETRLRDGHARWTREGDAVVVIAENTRWTTKFRVVDHDPVAFLLAVSS